MQLQTVNNIHDTKQALCSEKMTFMRCKATACHKQDTQF